MKRSFEEYKDPRKKKKLLIEERGHRREKCKFDTWNDQPVPLELEHIDGHPGHNEKSNLMLLCPNCHAQTPHYRGKNAKHHKDTVRQRVMKKYPDYRALKIRGLDV